MIRKIVDSMIPRIIKPQTGVQNHCQQYSNDTTIQRFSLKNDYDREKGVAHGMILSGIPTPEKQATEIILLKQDSNY